MKDNTTPADGYLDVDAGCEDSPVDQQRLDEENGRQWRENSSLEKWFPFTAEKLAALEAEVAELRAERAESDALRTRLKDPAVVHINMLNGTIAQPSQAQYLHLIGDDLKALRELQQRVAQAIAHIEPPANVSLYRPGLQGCSDGGCIINPPTGLHTNGGCNCAKTIRRGAGDTGLNVELTIHYLRGELRKLLKQQGRIQ